MDNLFCNNCSVLDNSTNGTFTTRSKPCSYIFLKFIDRCEGLYIIRANKHYKDIVRYLYNKLGHY